MVDAAVFEGHGVGGFEAAAGAEVGSDSLLGWCGEVGVLALQVGLWRFGGGRNTGVLRFAQDDGAFIYCGVISSGEVGDDHVRRAGDGAFYGDGGLWA